MTHPECSPSGGITVIGDVRNLAEDLHGGAVIPTVIARNTEPMYRSYDISFTRDKQLKPKPLSETCDAFRSLSSNFMPSGEL